MSKGTPPLKVVTTMGGGTMSDAGLDTIARLMAKLMEDPDFVERVIKRARKRKEGEKL